MYKTVEAAEDAAMKLLSDFTRVKVCPFVNRLCNENCVAFVGPEVFTTKTLKKIPAFGVTNIGCTALQK